MDQFWIRAFPWIQNTTRSATIISIVAQFPKIRAVLNRSVMAAASGGRKVLKKHLDIKRSLPAYVKNQAEWRRDEKMRTFQEFCVEQDGHQAAPAACDQDSTVREGATPSRRKQVVIRAFRDAKFIEQSQPDPINLLDTALPLADSVVRLHTATMASDRTDMNVRRVSAQLQAVALLLGALIEADGR